MAVFSLSFLIVAYCWLAALVAGASQLGMLIALAVIGLGSDKPLF